MKAITPENIIIRFIQVFGFALMKAITPVMLTRGNQAAIEDHLALESGKKLGREGRSGG